MPATVFFLISFWLHYPFLASSHYSDFVGHLWVVISSSRGIVPYVDYQLEYPALAGLILYISSIWRNLYAYYWTISLITYLFMLMGLYVLNRILILTGQPSGRIHPFVIFTPSFLFLSIYSFDWVGISLLLVSIYYACTKKAARSGLSLGLSTAARIIPVLCLPFIVHELKESRERVIVLVAAFVGWLAPNLYFMISNFQGFVHVYIFQAEFRVEDSWLNVIGYFSLTVAKVLSGILLVSLLFLTFRRRNRYSLPQLCLITLLAFVLVSYKFPPQYMILLLPLFALNKPSYWIFLIADLLNVMIVLLINTIAFSPGDPFLITSPIQWIAVARQLLFLPMFLRSLRVTSETSAGRDSFAGNHSLLVSEEQSAT